MLEILADERGSHGDKGGSKANYPSWEDLEYNGTLELFCSKSLGMGCLCVWLGWRGRRVRERKVRTPNNQYFIILIYL